jgi:hypothetical protein
MGSAGEAPPPKPTVLDSQTRATLGGRRTERARPDGRRRSFEAPNGGLGVEPEDFGRGATFSEPNRSVDFFNPPSVVPMTFRMFCPIFKDRFPDFLQVYRDFSGACLHFLAVLFTADGFRGTPSLGCSNVTTLQILSLFGSDISSKGINV